MSTADATVPHRARLAWARSQVPGRRAVAGPDPARGRELPDQRHARSSRVTSTPSRGSRPPRPGQRRRSACHRRAGDGDPGRRRRRSSTGDHDDQFPIDVFQTGSGTSSNMNVNEVIASLAARAGSSAPERPRQRQPVLQRHLPDVDPRRGGAGSRRATCGRRSTSSPTRSTRKAEEFADAGEVGPHPPDGRHAGHARPGARRVRRDRPATRVERLDATLPRVRELPLGRHGGRHRHQHPARLRRAGDRRPQRGHRRAVHRGPQPLRGPGHPGLAGRAERRAPDVSPSA